MASSQGILYVCMQPKEQLSLDHFHEWYNNEHGPTRLRLPDIFSNGLRYRAVDDERPEFMAVYDVHSMPLLNTDRYLSLRANRSSREAATIEQVDVKRCFFDLLHTKQADNFVAPEQLSDQEAEDRLTVAVEIALVDTADAGDEYARWYMEEHVEMLSKVPGWLRSRLFKPSSVEADGPKNTFFMLHDYSKNNGLGGAEHKASMDTPRRTRIFDQYVSSKGRRTFQLFYVFGPAPRDLSTLSRLSQSDSFAAADGSMSTKPGSDAVISSYVTASDALRIPYRLEGNSSPDAPTVAFCNSLLTSLHMWDPFIAILKRERPDLRILRYDFRGRHEMPQPARAATLEDMTQDLLAVLDALRIFKLHALIGVSMGGATTLDFAINHPGRLRRFIACDFNVASSDANTSAWKERIAVAKENDGLGIKTLASQTVSRWFHPSTMEKQDIVDWMTDMVSNNNVEGFANSCTALWDYDLKPDMERCVVPGLLVAGEGDGKGALVKAMDGFKDKIGTNGVKLEVVPNAGHLPMCEEPRAYFDTISGFI